MSTISINNLARAIYESSKGKDGTDLEAIARKSAILIYKKRLLGKSNEIIKQLEDIIDKNDETIRAKISSRVKLDKKITESLENFIKKRYKAKNVILEYEVDPKLLGGIKIEVGNEIIDSTIKNKIKKLENYLIKN